MVDWWRRFVAMPDAERALILAKASAGMIMLVLYSLGGISLYLRSRYLRPSPLVSSETPATRPFITEAPTPTMMPTPTLYPTITPTDETPPTYATLPTHTPALGPTVMATLASAAAGEPTATPSGP